MKPQQRGLDDAVERTDEEETEEAELVNAEAVRVAIRVRPSGNTGEEVLAIGQDRQSLSVIAQAKQNASSTSNGAPQRFECRYDRVFGEESTQVEVYEFLRPTVVGVIHGVNTTIFAYGQTGTGKTHTMIGPESALYSSAKSLDVQCGVIPRAVHDLFATIDDEQLQAKKLRQQTNPVVNESATKGACSMTVYCSYLQIYNEKIFDLLSDQDHTRPLTIRENAQQRNVYVSGLTEIRMSAWEDIVDILRKGNNHRVVRGTDFNAHSSRSHAILQLSIHVEATSVDGRRAVRKAKLNLVDLAGSEKWSSSSSAGTDQTKEMTNINTSLSALGNCIAALTEQKRKHIPYRDSTLTRLLQDSLGGSTRTCLVATVSSSPSAVDETIRTLRFADRAKRVMESVRINEIVSDSVLLARARKEIVRLRAQLVQRQKDQDMEEILAALRSSLSQKDVQIQQLKAENIRLKDVLSTPPQQLIVGDDENLVQSAKTGECIAPVPKVDQTSPSFSLERTDGGSLRGNRESEEHELETGARNKQRISQREQMEDEENPEEAVGEDIKQRSPSAQLSTGRKEDWSAHQSSTSIGPRQKHCKTVEPPAAVDLNRSGTASSVNSTFSLDSLASFSSLSTSATVVFPPSLSGKVSSVPTGSILSRAGTEFLASPKPSLVAQGISAPVPAWDDKLVGLSVQSTTPPSPGQSHHAVGSHTSSALSLPLAGASAFHASEADRSHLSTASSSFSSAFSLAGHSVSSNSSSLSASNLLQSLSQSVVPTVCSKHGLMMCVLCSRQQQQKQQPNPSATHRQEGQLSSAPVYPSSGLPPSLLRPDSNTTPVSAPSGIDGTYCLKHFLNNCILCARFGGSSASHSTATPPSAATGMSVLSPGASNTSSSDSRPQSNFLESEKMIYEKGIAALNQTSPAMLNRNNGGASPQETRECNTRSNRGNNPVTASPSPYAKTLGSTFQTPTQFSSTPKSASANVKCTPTKKESTGGGSNYGGGATGNGGVSHAVGIVKKSSGGKNSKITYLDDG